jgi:dTDP-4-amino-4,6-dideoxy-D-galactose acyltransferase
MAGSRACELLEWDTEFWGVPVGRVVAGEVGPEVDEWASAKGIACMYFLVASGVPEAARAAEERGFKLVDVRVELDRPTAGDETVAVRAAHADDVEQLRTLAGSVHRGETRFYADPGFPDERCDELYALWIERSVEGWADEVFVAEAELVADSHKVEVVGYVSCHADEPSGRGSIGLIGVGEAARGRGLGAALVKAAVAWSRERGLHTTSVVTQGRNVQAQRLFQRCGFRTAAVDLWFHKWYDR